MSFLVIIACYALCHGLTAWVVTPVQSHFLPQITVFASLVYLPHGVRVLATWAFGWKAIPALLVGESLSAWMFTPTKDLDFLGPGLIGSLVVGAASAFIAFEIARLVGINVYLGGLRRLKWKGLIAVGALSSIVNSVGQTLVFSGIIDLEKVIGVWTVYAIGDLIGLIVCMVVLMFVFRWSRVFSVPKSDSDPI
ncbi:MAG: hypothetical protein ABJ360_16755 [Roseobacter sp.]|uniref:hypothetical protein n=1 Tax=Tateyamaria sp. TaxID=1929288 RepID=UPI003274A8B9